MPSQNVAPARKRTNLLQRKQGWYARYFVPKHLQGAYGRREVQRTLGTRDKLEANRRLPTVLSELQREVAEAVRSRIPVDYSSPADVVRELEAIEAAVRRGEYTSPDDPAQVHPADLAVELTLEAHSTRLGSIDPDTGLSSRLSSMVTDAAGQTLRALHDPKYKPLSEWANDHIRSMENKGLKRSTCLARERLLDDFIQWAGLRRDPRLMTDDDAVAYVDRLNASSASTRKRQDTAGHVRALFEWLRKNRKLIRHNPFADMREQIETNPDDDELDKRPWHAEELETIIKGLNPAARLWPISVIALYSGMRINEICSMEVKHVSKLCMTITRENAKNDNSARDVPIHPLIAPLVVRLVATSYDGFLISGIKPGGQDERRGAYPSKRFSEHRKTLGLIDPDTTFHSFRHNFATAAERALIPEPTIKLLTGHARQGITLNRYSDGPEMRTKVEAMAKITHDRQSFEDQPAVSIDALVASLLQGHQGNKGWKGRKLSDLIKA